MSNLVAPAYETINPHMRIPGIILPYSQVSGAFNLLPDEQPRVMLGEGDMAVYMTRLDVRTKTHVGQAASNELPSPTIVASQISTPTYLVRVRAEYDHHDTARAGAYGFSLTQATRLANQQAICNTGRVMLLYGTNPANGEGLVNANGATAVSLPPDSFGNATVTAYDNGQMGFFLLSQILAIKTRTNNLGIGRKFTILGPQRTLGAFEYNVVQVTSVQRPGGGTTSTAGVVKTVLMDNGDEIIWCYDDTLIGKGAGGTDAVVINMPEVEKPTGGAWNTNRFAEISPGFEGTTMMLCDLIAPREITVPLTGGAVDTVYEQRMTSGWAIRPESVTVLSMAFQ